MTSQCHMQMTHTSLQRSQWEQTPTSNLNPVMRKQTTGAGGGGGGGGRHGTHPTPTPAGGHRGGERPLRPSPARRPRPAGPARPPAPQRANPGRRETHLARQAAVKGSGERERRGGAEVVPVPVPIARFCRAPAAPPHKSGPSDS